MSAKPIGITIAEGNALMLTALSELIEEDPRFSLMSTVTSAEDCLKTSFESPGDVLVVDWLLPTLGAEKLIKVLRDENSPMRVVVCTHVKSLEVPKRAMAAGAAGFFCHTSPSEELLEVIATVAIGSMVFPYLDVRELADPLQTLTKTERALLASLSLGRTNKELASNHNIAVNTVKFHLRNLYDKLNVRNRSQAIALYYSLNLADDFTTTEMRSLQTSRDVGDE